MDVIEASALNSYGSNAGVIYSKYYIHIHYDINLKILKKVYTRKKETKRKKKIL